MHEVKLIERARMKAAWEKEMKPDVGDPQSLELYLNYLEVMETDEWAFREQEIQEIQDLRLHLLEKMIAEVMENSKTRTETKMQSFIARIEAEKNEKIKKIRKQTSRELRKLENQMKGVRKRYQQPDIIDEFADTKSEYYAPLLRYVYKVLIQNTNVISNTWHNFSETLFSGMVNIQNVGIMLLTKN